MTHTILTVEKVVTGYNSRVILHNVSCRINAGSINGIIGPNGSGKTTLLRALRGILKPYSGTILLKGKKLDSYSFKELAREIAVVSQDISESSMSVEEYVLLGRLPYFKPLQFFETKKDHDTAYSYMELTGSLALKDKLIHEISGGERQLAGIAKALTQEPALLLLDEPTSHLDIKHQIKILDLIKKLNRTLGLTVIMVIHDLNLAGEYCDNLFLLNRGEIHSFGPPTEVLTYKAIEEVYETVVIVEKNPLSGKPYVMLVSGDELKKKS